MGNYENKRVTVMGLGLFGGGLGVTKFFCREGAKVLVTDLSTKEKLSASLSELSEYDIEYKLGYHDIDDFTSTDIVVVNPAVPLESPYLKAARDAGVLLETELNLFMRLCKSPIAGITGANGKSTTTSLSSWITSQMIPSTLMGGNIGKSLLDMLDVTGSEVPVILELSSFQLENLRWLGKSPHVAVITNITPNHIDRHKTMQGYIDAKKAILDSEARQVGAHAAVDADSEGQDRLARPVEVHHGRVGKDVRVKIAGRKDRGNAVALLHLHAAHLVVLRQHAAREGHRPGAQQFLDLGVDVGGIVDHLLATLGISGQPQPYVVERREDRVEAADEQEHDEAEDLRRAHRPAVHRRVDDTADHVLVRVLRLLGDHFLEVGADHAHGFRHDGAIVRMEQIDRPLHEGVALVLGQAHQVEKHRYRQRSAEIGGELAFALGDDLVDQIVGHVTDLAFEREHALGREHRFEDRAVLAVVRRIDLDRDEVEIVIRIAREGRRALVGEDVRMAQHEHGMLVLKQMPGVAVVADVVIDGRHGFVQPGHVLVQLAEQPLNSTLEHVSENGCGNCHGKARKRRHQCLIDSFGQVIRSIGAGLQIGGIEKSLDHAAHGPQQAQQRCDTCRQRTKKLDRPERFQ